MIGGLVSLDWILFGLRVLATVVLYVFLGVAFYLILRDLKRQNQATIPSPQLADRLRVIATTEAQAFGVGQTFPLQSIVWLGCGPESTIVVHEAAVSARQARLMKKDGVWWLENLGHSNGIKVNNAPLSQPTALANGDVIEIAGVRFRLETMTTP